MTQGAKNKKRNKILLFLSASAPQREDTWRMTENEIGTIVVDAAIAIHRNLGPGLLETVYEVVLARELQDKGLKVERQVSVPIEYRDIRFDEGFRADIIVEGKVILELKSVERVTGAHKKQVQTGLFAQLWGGPDEKRDYPVCQWS